MWLIQVVAISSKQKIVLLLILTRHQAAQLVAMSSNVFAKWMCLHAQLEPTEKRAKLTK
jgi:hypothetical protein